MPECPEQLIEKLAAGRLNANERGALLDHAAGCAECRAMFEVGEAPPATAPADRIGRYELGDVLGRGATGVVYAAHDPELDRAVAIKVLRSAMPAERLRREAQALAKLAHPNVVRVYDVGEHEGETFIAMELVEGTTLRDWLREPREVANVIDVMIRAGRGLAAAHRAGLVHRDFKPDNVLLAKTGEVLVGDFGLARAITDGEVGAATSTALTASAESLTATGALVGTPAYMSPEQLGADATPASDQFAFCVAAWEACFGARPFTGATLGELADAVRAGTIVVPPDRDVPARVERALRRGLSARAGDRFASIEDLLRALAPPVRRRAPWIAAGVLGVAGLAATVFWTRLDRSTCDVAAAWEDGERATIAQRWGEGLAADLERYVTQWQDQRAAACGNELRAACLDRARATLRATIGTLLVAPRESLPRHQLAVSVLPPLDRCERDEAAPPIAPELAGPFAVLDAELTAADLSLLAGWAASPTEVSRLRERAEGLGHAPYVLRALLLEARLAAWTGDARAAEAILRRVLVSAETLADDRTRAEAGAWLAQILAEPRPDEAATTLAVARAAGQRAGIDPALEYVLLEAEIAIAHRRNEHARALALQEQVVALAKRRFGDGGGVLAHAYSRLSVLANAAGEPTRGATAYEAAMAIAMRYVTLEGQETLKQNQIVPLLRGDFAGAVEISRNQLTVLRRMPGFSPKLEAEIGGQLAFALETGGELRDAVTAYSEAERLWRRPADVFRASGEQLDPVAIADGIFESIHGRAVCLYRLGELAESIRELERALAAATTPLHVERANRWLGIALTAAGEYRRARVLLLELPEQLFPFPRGQVRFALARALWADGGLADRPRALALASDAERDFTEAIALGVREPVHRLLPARARAMLEEIAAWRASRDGEERRVPR